MKAVVFGGSGFLGSHLADALTDRGIDVTIFDRVPSRHARDGQRMVVGDILDASAVTNVLADCDYAYHFAGLADLDDATTQALETVRLNIEGTVKILDAAVRARVKRVIYASTIYVYSALGGFYRCSKQAGELYVEEYQKRYGLDYTILRHGTLYGPRADMRNSLHRYLRQGLTDGIIRCTGSAEDVREYIHVRDAAKLSVDILNNRFRNQHVIITGHDPMKVTDLMNMLQEILNRKVTVEFTQAPNSAHYVVTPYSFLPKIGSKLVNTCYIDMGQGLLECVYEIFNDLKMHERTILPGDPTAAGHSDARHDRPRARAGHPAATPAQRPKPSPAQGGR